jgi:hypothetical protein
VRETVLVVLVLAAGMIPVVLGAPVRAENSIHGL